MPSVPGVHAGCKVYIRRNAGTQANKIVKPFIVVEGLDINSALPSLEENYDINKFIGEINSTYFITGQNFSDQLDDVSHYDLVFVDWNNGVGDIPGNAQALESVLDYIESIKVPDNNNVLQQNVVMGISMGGLISRYCLADMVKRSPRKATHTRLLLTMDSPHQGAYVPLAFQHLVMTLPDAKGPLGIRFGSIMHNALDDVKNKLLLSPGAQEELNLLVTNASGGVAANSFLPNIYRPKITFTDPNVQPEYAFKAIADGSQCGIPVIPIGSSLASASASAGASGAVITIQAILGYLTVGIPIPIITKLKYKVELASNGLTGTTSHEILHFLMKREEKLFFVISNNKTFVDIHRSEPSFNTVPWESVSGGTQSIGDRLGAAPGSISGGWSFISPWFLGYKYQVSLAPRWGFLPVTSALDIQNPPSQSGQYIFGINGTNGSTSSKYIAQEQFTSSGGTLYNKNHTDLTARNAQWIYNEMENIVQPVDCYATCATPKIIGATQFCGSTTFSILNLPPASTVTWTASPFNIVSLGSPNAGSTSVNQISAGQVTIKATINNTCSTAPLTKVVQVGAYPLSNYSVTGAAIVYASAGYHYSLAYPFPNLPNNIFWRVPTGWTILSGQGTNDIHVWTGSQGGAVQCDFDNICSEATGVYETVVIGVGGPDPESTTPETSKLNTGLQLTATPNPASNKVLVSLIADQSTAKTSDGQLNIRQIKITDKTGMIKKQFSFNTTGSSQVINVQDMLPDVYFIQAFTGKEWLSCKLVIVK